MNPEEQACRRLEGPPCIHCVERKPISFWCDYNDNHLFTPVLDCPHYKPRFSHQEYDEAVREYNRRMTTAAIVGVSGAIMIALLFIGWIS